MYNDHLSDEEARELIKQRVKEAETYSRQKQLGFGDSGAVRWGLVLTLILVMMIVGLLL